MNVLMCLQFILLDLNSLLGWYFKLQHNRTRTLRSEVLILPGRHWERVLKRDGLRHWLVWLWKEDFKMLASKQIETKVVYFRLFDIKVRSKTSEGLRPHSTCPGPSSRWHSLELLIEEFINSRRERLSIGRPLYGLRTCRRFEHKHSSLPWGSVLGSISLLTEGWLDPIQKWGLLLRWGNIRRNFKSSINQEQIL